MALYDDFRKSREARGAPATSTPAAPAPSGSLHAQYRAVKDTNAGKPDTSGAESAARELSSQVITIEPKPSPFSRFKTVATRYKNFTNSVAGAITREAVGAAREIKQVWSEGAKNLVTAPDKSQLAKDTGKELWKGTQAFGFGMLDVVKNQAPKAVYTAISAAAENADKISIPVGLAIPGLGAVPGLGANVKLPRPITDKAKVISEWSNEVIKYIDGEQRKRLETLGVAKDTPITQPTNFGYQFGTGIGSLGLAIGTTIVTKNPWSAAGMLGWLEGSDTYNVAKEKLRAEHPELDEDTIEGRALAAATADSVGIALLEKVGLDALFRSYGKGVLYKAARNAITESFQEGAQTVWSNLVAKFGFDRSRVVLEDLVDTIIVTAPIGFLGGAGMSMADSGVDPDTQVLDDAAKKVAQKHKVPADVVAEAAKPVLDELRGAVEQLGTGTPLNEAGEAIKALSDDIRDALKEGDREAVKKAIIEDPDIPITDEMAAEEAVFGAETDAAEISNEVDELIKSAEAAMTARRTTTAPISSSQEEGQQGEEAEGTEGDIELPAEVEEVLGELSDSQELKDDWEENHAEEFGELATRLAELEKQHKESKNKDERAKLRAEGEKISDKMGQMENAFIDKYRKQAEDIVKAREAKRKRAVKEAAAEVDGQEVSRRSVKELFDERDNVDGAPWEFREEVERLGVDATLTALGFSTDRNTVYYNRHTGHEETLGDLIKGDLGRPGGRTIERDEAEELAMVLEHWLPMEDGTNPVMEETRKRTEEDVREEAIRHLKPYIERSKDVDEFLADVKDMGGSFENGNYDTKKGKYIVKLYDGREFSFSLRNLYKDTAGSTIEGNEEDTDTRGGVRRRKGAPRRGDGGARSGSSGGADTERGERVAREQDSAGGDELGERPSARLEELVEDAEEHQEALATDDDEIKNIVEFYTAIDDEGEVRLIDERTISEDELSIINTYIGAGGREKQGAEGRGLLDEYYTPGDIATMLSELLSQQKAWRSGGMVLEPSVGTGNFLGDVPGNQTAVGFEINETAARIAKLNFPNATIFAAPFESNFMDERGKKVKSDAVYDVVFGNPPYGEHRGRYKGMGEERNIAKYEEYFIKRGLDLLKPGGHLAMVVPSSFLRSPADKVKELVAKQGKLVEAYRLPNGAFPTTTIGTDIVVFEKKPTDDPLQLMSRKQTTSDDIWFRNVMHRDRILGTETTKKGRYGIEPWVEGSLEDAADRFFSQIGKDFAQTVSTDEDVQAGVQEDLFESYKPELYKDVVEAETAVASLSTILNDFDSRGSAIVATRKDGVRLVLKDEGDFVKLGVDLGTLTPTDVALPEKTFASKLEAVNYIREMMAQETRKRQGLAPELLGDIPYVPKEGKAAKKKADKNKKVQITKKASGKTLDLAQYSTAEEDSQWENVAGTGELAGNFDKSKAFFFRGKWYNRFNYAQGDIYEKLDALEEEKDVTGVDYEKQKAALEAVLPEPVTLERASITPNSRFAQETEVVLDGEDVSLANAFLDWIAELPIGAFGESNRWAIQGYVYNRAVRGDDKLRNEQERRTRRIEGDRLFKLFLTENLPDDVKKDVTDRYNRQFNAYARPDYRNVPLVGKVNADFHGKPLEIKEVQLQGVGFLVNRGVGLLAHDVGVGKTMQTIIAINETMLRGWARRPLIVVPSINVYNQWVNEIEELIPGAKLNLLANLGGDFKGDLASLEIPDGSISIVTEEGFKRLGFSDETYADLTMDFLDVIENPNERKTKRQAAKDAAKADEQLGKGVAGTLTDKSFEDLGFDLLAVDEVHNANHIIPRAKMDKEKGQVSEFRNFSVQPSIYGIKVWLAAQYIQKKTGGRNVYLASATPFTNNPLEYYSVLSLMARERMRRMGLLNVNDFMTAFMEITTLHEFKADGAYVEKSEVRSFKNYQQFQKLLTEFIDFRDGEEAGVKRPERVSHEYLVGQTEEMAKYNEAAQSLFEDTKNAGALKAINELRAVAFSPHLSREYNGPMPTAATLLEASPKLRTTVALIKQTLADHPEGGQLIYSTIGVELFPLLREAIVAETGLKPAEVEIISGATPKHKRSGIQEAFNAGSVKVVLGSDAIQEGVNLQQNTTDLYILSLPWNFTQLRQVIGRAWRQGNKWRRMRVNTVFVENSIDVFLSQKLQNKEKRYSESLKFKGDNLDVGDIDFEELKLELITDPVRRTNLDFEFRKQEMEHEIKRLIAEQAYKNRRAAQLIDARAKVKQFQGYVDEGADWAKRSLEQAKEKLDEIEKKLTEKGIDVADIENELTDADAEVDKMRGQIEKLEDEKKDALKAAIDSSLRHYTGVRETDVEAIVKERSDENKTFFAGGPLFERVPATTASGKLWARDMDRVLTVPEIEAVTLAFHGHITEETRPLLNSAYEKYLEYMGERREAFERHLSTPLLEELKGREKISVQFLRDAIKRPGVKKAEAQAIEEVLTELRNGTHVNVEQFAEKYAAKLLALEVRVLPQKEDDEGESDLYQEDFAKWEHINLPEAERADVFDYNEILYLSPIKTKAGQRHFNETNYFAHTRQEDLIPVEHTKPTEAMRTVETVTDDLGNKRHRLFEDGALVKETGRQSEAQGWEIANAEVASREFTRRILEIQSDLFQKGGLEDETTDHAYEATQQRVERLEMRLTEAGSSESDLIQEELAQANKDLLQLEKEQAEKQQKVLPGIKKLEPYRNTWHERIVREEIRMAAKEGITLLQFPSGATAMKVEGMGEQERFRNWSTEISDAEIARNGHPWATPENIKVGHQLRDMSGGDWIITDVLEDGKFRAVPEQMVVDLGVPTEDALKILQGDSAAETFDISGKVDTNNPIYRFYENEVQKYLRKIRSDVRKVTDRFGNTWFETTITDEDKERPVMAFQRTPFETFKYQATSFDEAKATLEAYQKRFNLAFDIDFAHAIFTGEYQKHGFEKRKVGAFAVTYNNRIALTENVTRTTADHEMVHLVAGNLDKIPAFAGITENALLRAVNGGREFTDNEVDALSEKLAVGFEQYVAGRAQNQATIVTRFYQLLLDLWTDFLRAFGSDIPVVKDFYDRLARATSEAPVVLESDRMASGEIELPGRTGNLILDFGLPQQRLSFDSMIRESFFERLPQLLDEESDDLNPNLVRKDINALEKLTAQARDLYLRDPNEFAAARTFEKIGDARREKKAALDARWSEMLAPYFKELSKSEREKVNAALMRGDEEGIEYDDEKLRALNLSAKQVEGYKAVRKSFNLAHELLLSEMAQQGVPEEEIRQFEQERIGYMPHKWKYRFVIKKQQMVKGRWKTTEMSNYRSMREATAEWEKMKAENASAEVRFVLDTLDNLEVDFFTEQRLSFEAMKSAMEQAKTSDEIKKVMIGALRNMMKEKGFGRHYIRRTGVRGYETKEVPQLIANYFSGLDGFLTKMEAGKRYYETLSTVDARRQSRFYEWLRGSIAYDMSNSKEWEWLRRIAFIWYLANDLSFLLVNATQNYIVGAGELSKHLTGAAKIAGPEVRITGAIKDWNTGNVTRSERATVERLLELGELGGEMIAEMMAFKNNPLYSEISSRLSKAMYKTTAFVESSVNRVPLFLAARRLFLEQGMSEKEANEKAIDLSNDVHFRYGRQHRPEFMRGNPLHTLFVFHQYLRSFLYLLSRDLTKREYAAFTRRILYLTALGGTMSLPFAKTLIAVFREIFGAGCKAGEEGDCSLAAEMHGWELAIKKGLPALTGIDLSGRVGIDILSINSIIEDPNDIRSYIGAALNLVWWNPGDPDQSGRAMRGVELLRQGRYDDALAHLLPDMFANPIKGFTGYTWGVRSFAGTPLEDTDGTPLKYSAWEAVIRGIGFSPTREGLAWDAKSRQFEAQEQEQRERDTVRRTIQAQIQRGDYEGARTEQERARAAGIIDDETDYIRQLGKSTFMREAYTQWKEGEPGSVSVRALERDLVEKLYGKDATDRNKNDVRRAFAVYRTFGMDNRRVNELLSAGSNAEKVEILKEIRAEDGEEAFREIWVKGKKTITTEAGSQSRLLISEELEKLFRKSANTP